MVVQINRISGIVDVRPLLYGLDKYTLASCWQKLGTTAFSNKVLSCSFAISSAETEIALSQSSFFPSH